MGWSTPIGSIDGYPAWVPSVPREVASNAGMGCAGTTIVRIPNKAGLLEKLLFGSA
jgi:hypothetical protein